MLCDCRRFWQLRKLLAVVILGNWGLSLGPPSAGCDSVLHGTVGLGFAKLSVIHDPTNGTGLVCVST